MKFNILEDVSPSNETVTFRHVDWVTIGLYILMVVFGLLNIYASVYDEQHPLIWDLSQSYGKQLLWIGTASFLIGLIFTLPSHFFSWIAYPLYTILVLLLIVVIFVGSATKGSHSWFEIGSIKIQPAEFAKFGTALALAKLLSDGNHWFEALKQKALKIGPSKQPWVSISYAMFVAVSLFLIPLVIIILENETGTALVYFAFAFVVFREGLSASLILIGLGAVLIAVLALLFSPYDLLLGLVLLSIIFLTVQKFKKNAIWATGVILLLASSIIFSVDYGFSKLQPHQKTRINVLLGKESDPKGVEYNINQAKIAIGSGGTWGKGFLKGTQTKLDYVPEQNTDFIFCTVAEEWGFMGSTCVIFLFVGLILRLIWLAERQNSAFARVYGYSVALIIAFHFMVNMGMTIGFMPIIGIPLPFFSYGGSSLWSFTILLFIFLKLDATRMDKFI